MPTPTAGGLNTVGDLIDFLKHILEFVLGLFGLLVASDDDSNDETTDVSAEG